MVLMKSPSRRYLSSYAFCRVNEQTHTHTHTYIQRKKDVLFLMVFVCIYLLCMYKVESCYSGALI
ncbi:hypothetical protein BDB01DRAFT_250859 [Pilobolus umbonatus]|nr:hypothetical protein BDB01DRAFT_250859 [Pilobolus umbonatus]